MDIGFGMQAAVSTWQNPKLKPLLASPQLRLSRPENASPPVPILSLDLPTRQSHVVAPTILPIQSTLLTLEHGSEKPNFCHAFDFDTRACEVVFCGFGEEGKLWLSKMDSKMEWWVW